MPGLVEFDYRQPTVVAEKFQADFNLDFYDPRVSREKVGREVRAFLGEKLLQPRAEDVWIGKDGTLDPDYIAMMQRSTDYWKGKGDRAAVARFESELTGMRNLAYLVIAHGVNNEPLPVVLTASDPGNFYVGKDGNKKSVTFVGLLDRTEDEGWRYKIFSLPTKFIGLERHKDLLWKIGDIERTRQILGASLEDLTADNLVASPVLLDQLVHSLDELATSLGHESWDKIEEIAADQLALDNDHLAKERRDAMVEEFTRRIVEMVSQDKSGKEKEALVNAMGDTFALEAGREYVGWNGEQMVQEINRTVRVALADKLNIFSRSEDFAYLSVQYDLGGMRDLYEHVTWMANVFRTNPLAQEARATGCGGSGVNYSQGLGWDRFSFEYQQPTEAGFDMMQNFGYQSDVTISTNAESTGKYKDYYDYKPGVCANCHEHKSYVAHPKSPEVKCAGWCSGCEK